MSVLTAPRVTAASVGERRAVLALARFEALRLLRHPFVLAVLVFYVGWLVWPGGDPKDDFPVLQDIDREIQIGTYFIALAALLSANMASLRPHRHGTDAHFGVLVLRPWRRTCAHLLALLPLTLVTAALVAGQFLYAAARPDAVGHASFFELVTGPALVPLFGAVGVLLGRVTRSAFAAPLAVVVLVAAMFVFSAGGPRGQWSDWLTPLVFDEGRNPLPSGLVGRPAGWHALYLAGLTVLAGAGAVLLAARGHGHGRERDGGTIVRATALGALAATVAGAVLQGLGPSDGLEAARRTATERPSSMQECQRRGPTTYCAFPEFVPWAREWDGVVRGVRALVPADVAGRRLSVRQRVDTETPTEGSGRPGAFAGSRARDDRAAGTPDAVPVSTAWGGGDNEVEFAADVAYVLVTGEGPYTPGPMCDGRGVLVFWLATQATPRTEEGFASVQHSVHGGGGAVLDSPNSGGPDAFLLRDHEYAVLRALLDRPRDEVAGRVRASWDELTAKGTSTGRAAELLGVKAPALTADDRRWACS